MNGHLQKEAVRIIESKEETDQDEVNRLLLAMVLDNSETLDHPVLKIPEKWLKRGGVIMGAWGLWVTANVAGAKVSLKDLWELIRGLL